MNTEENIVETTNIDAGALLKQKREELGLTQQQVASRLKLKVDVIEKIEQNQFDKNQVATFTRGYYRSYAKAVAVNEKQVLAALDQAGSAQHEELEMQSFSRKTNVDKHNNLIMKLTWVIGAVLIGITIFWWWQNQQQDTLSMGINENAETQVEKTTQTEPESPKLVADKAVEDANVNPVSGAESATSETPEVTPVTTENNNAAVEPEVDPQAAVIAEKPAIVQETALPAGHKSLNLTFTSDCWIQVKDANGKVISTGLKKEGESLSLSGKTPMKIKLGAPEGVNITFASEPVDLSGYTAGKVARITLR